jgi:DNA-binding transcriptional LysR family regulator
MARIVFDLDVLRSFVTGIELGSFAKAADRLGRSTSAVSAQLKKLEDQVGQPILRKSGRGLALTAAGETLLAYARRLLSLNDEAASAMRGIDLEGSISLGLQEDFGETILTEILGRFARTHPNVKIDVVVARNVELIERVSTGRLDLALAWDAGTPMPHAESICELSMQWIGPADPEHLDAIRVGGLLPLASLESPCLMRSAATAALDRAGIAWRVAFTSHSLSGVWAAVAAGLGLTVRTQAGLPRNVAVIDAEYGAGHDTGHGELPALPRIGLMLLRSEAQLQPATQRLREIILQAVQQSLNA